MSPILPRNELENSFFLPSLLEQNFLFVLEEFDLFCNHKNQTLLYNLFDIAQSRAAPIIVIGISSSLDVIECLEKRVKSRFNHRQLSLFPMRKFEDYFEVIKHYLLVPDVGNSVAKKQWNSHVCKLLQANDVYKMFIDCI